MAWAFVGARGSANDKTAGTTIAMTVATANIAVDAIAVVKVVSDNLAASTGLSATNFHTALTDSAGPNSWTKLDERTQSTAGAAGDGVTASQWATKVTTGLTSGTHTVTCTFSASITASAISLSEYSVAAGQTFSKITTFQTSGTGTAMTNSPSGLANSPHLFSAAIGYEGPTTAGFTIDADYTATAAPGTTGSTSATNVTLRDHRRIATETGNTNTPTNGAATDWVSLMVILDEVSASGGFPWPRPRPGQRRLLPISDEFLDLERWNV